MNNDASRAREAQIQFLRLADPYIKLKADIHMRSLVLVMTSDGMAFDYRYSPEDQALIDQIDEVIEHIAWLVSRKARG